MKCPLYFNERKELIGYATINDPAFSSMNDQDKFVYLLSNDNIISKTASILQKILHTRLHNTTK